VKPVTVSTTVAKPPREVFEFLDVLPNHAGFLGHQFTDWQFSGPRRGVGARARARANVVASQDWTEFEVLEATPERIVEEGVGAGGKRRTRGVYRLEETSDGGTAISFEFAWIEASRPERLAPPLIRAFARRVNSKAIKRLAKQLDG
jgi:Polyketide cyclase / dehydrase and lipid transport